MYYTYQELREAAMSESATAADRIRLFNWFENEDMADWNGEYFDMDDGLRLYPVYDFEYDEDGEVESVKLVDAEIR